MRRPAPPAKRMTSEERSEPFVVEVGLATPIALGPNGLWPALDATLAFLQAEREGKGRIAAPFPRIVPPLTALAEDIYAGTVLMPDPKSLRYLGFVSHPHTYARKAIRSLDPEAPAVLNNEGGGPFAALPRTFASWQVERAFWWGQGDREAVTALLLDEHGEPRLRAVGAQRNIGYGRVSSIAVRPLRQGFRLVNAQGLLMRTVPVRLATELGLPPDGDGLQAYIGTAAVRQPLWLAENQERCLIPLPPDTAYMSGII